MGQFKLYTFATLTLDGEHTPLGSLSRPVSVTITEKIDKTVTVAASGTETLLDVSSDPIGDFDILYLACDRNVMIEMVIDDNGTYGEAYNSFRLYGTGVANKYGIPLVLGADDAYANQSTPFGGTLDVIERILAKNLDSTNAAQVRIVAAT